MGAEFKLRQAQGPWRVVSVVSRERTLTPAGLQRKNRGQDELLSSQLETAQRRKGFFSGRIPGE
jgi:hypothetical protein